MEEEKNNGKAAAKNLNLKKPLKEYFTEDMKEDFNKIKNNTARGLYRIFAVLATIAFGWIVFNPNNRSQLLAWYNAYWSINHVLHFN